LTQTQQVITKQKTDSVSVVILAKNEEVNIERCVNAVQWSDDVVVIDDGSTDQTAHLAASCGARVVQHRFASFAGQRNWAMLYADLKHDWVLHLDADEVVTPELRYRLQTAVADAADDTVAFRMCRKTMLLDNWLKYSDGFPVWIMRLVRNGRAAFEDAGHGEVAVPEVDGLVATIREPFLHYAFSKGLTDWIERHNRYSSLEAELELEAVSGIKLRTFFSSDRAIRRRILRAFSRRLPFRPAFRFIYQYLLKRGFLDGRAGWTFSRMMAMYEGWIVMKRKELRRARRGLPSAESPSRRRSHDKAADGKVTVTARGADVRKSPS
jgi:glycosyltransferase involved in cell wall biosynthesis